MKCQIQLAKYNLRWLAEIGPVVVQFDEESPVVNLLAEAMGFRRGSLESRRRAQQFLTFLVKKVFYRHHT